MITIKTICLPVFSIIAKMNTIKTSKVNVLLTFVLVNFLDQINKAKVVRMIGYMYAEKFLDVSSTSASLIKFI